MDLGKGSALRFPPGVDQLYCRGRALVKMIYIPQLAIYNVIICRNSDNQYHISRIAAGAQKCLCLKF